jgi:predicted CXXCH cytochrome family protein
MFKKIFYVFLIGGFFLFPFLLNASKCVDCHKKITPGIVKQWEESKHFKNDVNCSTCHGEHTSIEDIKKLSMPTPETCADCHEERMKEFKEGKHALAWIAMKAMPMIAHQPIQIIGEKGFKGCSGCHKIGLKSEEEIKQGKFWYGTGSCNACHTRHKFSSKEARNPRACQTCHMGFDHPQWEMWSTSKHGTIWQIEGDTGRAPTCQTCHMPDGKHSVITAWGFLGLRVPEDDEEWWKDRVTILQALGVLDENGNPTERFEAVKAAKVVRLTKEDWQKERNKMIEVCSKCHSKRYVETQLIASDSILKDSDKMLAEAIRIVKELYDKKILKKPETWKFAPDLLQFYEAKSTIEQELYLMFLEYRMRTFQGAFHINPDYMHWYGWAKMKETLQKIKDEAEQLKKEHKKK